MSSRPRSWQPPTSQEFFGGGGSGGIIAETTRRCLTCTQGYSTFVSWLWKLASRIGDAADETMSALWKSAVQQCHEPPSQPPITEVSTYVGLGDINAMTPAPAAHLSYMQGGTVSSKQIMHAGRHTQYTHNTQVHTDSHTNRNILKHIRIHVHKDK